MVYFDQNLCPKQEVGGRGGLVHSGIRSWLLLIESLDKSEGLGRGWDEGGWSWRLSDG